MFTAGLHNSMIDLLIRLHKSDKLVFLHTVHSYLIAADLMTDRAFVNQLISFFR